MSEYRLTEKQVGSLNLTSVTWQDIREGGYDVVYIRAHSNSATYGPYKVKDASECLVCKLDGSDPRHYPRDKGLFVSQYMRRGYFDRDWKVIVPDTATSDKITLETMLTELSGSIIEKQKELKTLQRRFDVLTKLFKQV